MMFLFEFLSVQLHQNHRLSKLGERSKAFQRQNVLRHWHKTQIRFAEIHELSGRKDDKRLKYNDEKFRLVDQRGMQMKSIR